MLLIDESETVDPAEHERIMNRIQELSLSPTFTPAEDEN